MKVIIEMSPSEVVMLNEHISDLLLAASNDEVKSSAQVEAPKTAKERTAQKQEDAPSQPEQTPQPTPEQMPIPEPVIVPATQPVPTAVPIQTPVAAPAPIPTAAPAPIPTAAPRAFTLPEIAAASAQLRDAGKLNDLTALLAQFGVQAVTELAADQLQLFAQQLISMGARL